MRKKSWEKRNVFKKKYNVKLYGKIYFKYATSQNNG